MQVNTSQGEKSISHGLYLLKEQRNYFHKLSNRLRLTSYWSEHHYMLISKPVILKETRITLMGLPKLEPT